MSKVMTVVGTMALETAIDKTIASVPYLSEREVQLDHEQEGEQVGGSKAGEKVDGSTSDASLPPSPEEIVDGGSGREMVEDSEMQFHLRAIAEIEESVSQHEAEEIIISPDLRQSLPPAVEALMSRLESSSADDPLRELHSKDLRGYGTLFGGVGEPDLHEKLGQKPEEWVTGVRLLVMTAAGTCSTLELIDVRFLDMTIQELKALLQPLQSSSILRELYVQGNEIVDTKEGSKVVAEFLKYNRSLKILGLDIDDDSYLIHYLVAYGNPTLEILDTWYRLQKGEVLRGIIRACPNLQAMPSTKWKVEDEQTAKLYAQVLMEHKSFCRIRLRGPAGPVSSLLLSMCSGARSATSLTGLSIWITSDYWLSRNVLSPVILVNENLENIDLQSVHTGSEDWKRVFRALKQNGVLKSLDLREQRFDKDEGFDGSAWAEMVAMVEEGSVLETISLLKWGEYQHDLCALIDAVTSQQQMLHFLLENFDISAVESKAFVRLVQTNTSLITLSLSNLKGLNWKEFFSSLRLNTTIKQLDLSSNRTFDDRALSTLLVSLEMNSVLENIGLYETNWKREGKNQIVKYALQEKERQVNITYAFISTSTEDKAGVFKSLQQNVSLQRLYLSFKDSDNQFDANAWDMLEELLARDNSSFQSLVVWINSKKDSQQNLMRLFEIVSSSKSLRSFTLRSSHFSWEESEALEGVIKNNTSFTELILHLGEGVHWEKLFNALRYNDVLHTLNLSGITTLDERAFKELQATLQVNSALKVIDLSKTNWVLEGKDAIVREALEQKGRRETYMAHMKETLGQEKCDVPNTGRIFLCGSPHAGKTQLRKALTQIASSSASNGWSLKSYVQANHDLRTEGIEIEILNIDSLQISIWDLGGQEIFRTLQDVLFPKLNLVCVFFLVFSPFDHNTKCLKPALSEKLYREFVPWLRFIASNSQITGHMLPKVSIVVSHKDKLDVALPSDQHSLWVEGVVNGLRLQFAEVLDLEQKVFFTNSLGLGEDVQAVLHHTVESFKNLLKTKLFKVPTTCLTLGILLAEGGRYTQTQAKNHFYKRFFTFPKSCLSMGAAFAKCGTPSKSNPTREPILPMLEFFEFCQREVVSLQKINCVNAEGQKLMAAVAEYLHDAGHIIQFAKSKLVVVDPNWFTFSFMGRLVGSGHNFQNPIIRTDHFKCQTDGHLSTAAFKGLLQQFVQVLRQEGYDGVDEVLLERLMEELDLCFYISQVSGYFAPTVFAEGKLKLSSEGQRKLSDWQCVTSSSNMGHNMIFVGMRVQCRDQTRTMLTASFFPRFQVHFRNLLMSRSGLREDQIQCDYNLLYITFKEYEVYLENDGNIGDHIDILIRSPHSRTRTWKFIHQNVVQELQAFCASSKGCPGVTLVTGVLRTECVEKLTLSVHRNEHQAILVEELKRRWKEDILHKDVQSKFWEEEDIADFAHMWASNEDADLKKQYEKAKDLLTSEDYIEVLKSVKGSAESLEEQKSVLITIKNDIEKEIKERYVDSGMSSMSSDAWTSELQRSTLPVEFLTSKMQLQRASSDVLMGHEKTQYEIRKLGQEVGELRKELVEIRSILKDIQRDVGVVQHCQQEIFKIMMNINGKLDQLIGVTMSSARSELPSRPYLTASDVKWTHRIIARVNVGRAISLHFMCEERSGNHLISGQRGCPLIVTKENAEVLRFLCVNSMKILWYLLKAGVHVAAGLGNVIPDLEPAGGATLLTASALGSLLTEPEPKKNIGAEMVDSNPKTEYTRISKELWRYLQHEVSESFKGRCAEQFKLYRARYIAAPAEANHAWLCKGCFEKGIASNAIFDE